MRNKAAQLKAAQAAKKSEQRATRLERAMLALKKSHASTVLALKKSLRARRDVRKTRSEVKNTTTVVHHIYNNGSSANKVAYNKTAKQTLKQIMAEIKIGAVYDSTGSSVEDYAGVLKKNLTKFSEGDRLRINKC